MRLFFLTYAYESQLRPDCGGFRKLWEVAWAMQARGHEVCVFYPALAGYAPLRDVPARSYPVLGVRGFRPVTAYLSMLSTALRVGRQVRPDIIYFRSGLNVLPLWLGRLLKARVVLEVNGDPVEYFQHEGARTWAHFFRAIERWSVRGSDIVIAITPGLKRTLVERHRILGTNIRIIPSGTDPDHFMPADAKEAKTRLGFSPEAFVVGFVGLFYRHQGVDTLLEAAPQILKALPTTRFLIVGNGVMRPQWETLSERLGITHAVQFSGQIEYRNVPAFLQAMDVVTAPFTRDRGETSPFKILDALACGRPVVSSDLPSVRRLAQGFDEAITLVTPDDPNALAERVIALLQDPTRREKLGMRGRSGILRHYAWGVVGSQIEAALAQGADRDGSARPLQEIRRVPTRRSKLGGAVRFVTSHAPIMGLLPQPKRPEGISAIVRVKDEETWLTASIRSISSIADEIIVGDNGSTDRSVEILGGLARELPNRVRIFQWPNASIKDLTNQLIERTSFRWIIRWDADFVARTDGPFNMQRLRRWLFSLDRRHYWFVYLRMVELCGDLFHQRPETPSRRDCHCFVASPYVRYIFVPNGYEAPIVPTLYQVLRYEDPTFFHVDVKPTQRMFLSWLHKRFLSESSGGQTFEDYVQTELQGQWGDKSLEEAARFWASSEFRDLIPYDHDRFGDLPALLQPAIQRPAFQLRYEDGQIIGRSET